MLRSKAGSNRNGGSNYDSLKVAKCLVIKCYKVTVHFKECASWSGIKFDNSLAGNTVKLRGHPKALKLPSIDGNILCGQGNDLGYGKNVWRF
jgi:hypothetical protein